MELGALQEEVNKNIWTIDCRGVSTDAGAPGGDQLCRKT